MSRSIFAAIAAFGLIGTSSVHAIGVIGTVKNENNKPIAGVMISVRSASAAAIVTKVFTDEQGKFTVPDLGKNVQTKSIYADAYKLGFKKVTPASTALSGLSPKIEGNFARIDFILKPDSNIATQVPASAWLQLAPETPERAQTVLTCTQCHQLPNERIKKFSENLAGLDETTREQAWRGIIKAMRVSFYGALQAEHATPPSAEILEMIAKPENNFIDQKDEDITALWLAKHMPTNFDTYDISNKSRFANVALGTNGKTMIREFQYPENSFVRETAVIDGKVWVCDIARNRIGTLNPDTGAYRWYDVPAAGAPAPHTMVLDDQKNIWLTLLGGTGEMAAVFNPKTEKWRIYGGFPKEMGAHDFSQGPNYVMGFDKKDYTWMTAITHNKLIGFNRKTGEVSPIYDMPMHPGDTPLHTANYGGGMTSDKHVWFAQYNGVLGRFNTETRKVDYTLDYGYGAGPHRMAVANNDVIYVGLLGSGQISIFDAKALKEIKRVDLPDRSSALYSLAWDPSRKAIWAATGNNNSIFKYDIATGKFTEYPIEIKDLKIRMIALNHKNGDLWITNSPIPSNETEMRRVFLLHPGDR